MPTKEEIREGILKYIRAVVENETECETQTDAILTKLHSQGVVIKVDRELPDVNQHNSEVVFPFNLEEICVYKQSQVDMLKAGYLAVEPLIEV